MQFIKIPNDSLHVKRRKKIIHEYPEIQKLYGIEPLTKYIAIILVISQLYISVISSNLSFVKYISVLYFISASISQALFLINHEISHNLVFKKVDANIYFGMFVNLPAIFPYSFSFREYHLDHHIHMGIEGLDADIPSTPEYYLLQTRFGRFIWLSMQILMYAIRPILISPKHIKLKGVLNLLVQFIFDLVLYWLFGIRPFIFLILSLIIAGGLHPTAGHFISEHTLFDANNCEIDTRSYYGILNKITLNVGYHNEHHDFIYIPWSRLPLVKKYANKYYDDLPQCNSWILTLIFFCIDNPIRIIKKTK